MLEWLLKKITARLPHRTICSPDGRPYLTRWYVWPPGPRTQGEADEAHVDAPFAVFLHFFHRSDEDRACHSHPWDKSAAIILSGGYVEERVTEVHLAGTQHTTVETRTKTFRPGDVNIITKDDYHRVDLLYPDRGSWSLFVAGKNVGSWGFLDATSGKHVAWRDYNKTGDMK